MALLHTVCLIALSTMYKSRPQQPPRLLEQQNTNRLSARSSFQKQYFPRRKENKKGHPLPKVTCPTQLAKQKQLRVGRPGSYHPPLPPRGCLKLMGSRSCVSMEKTRPPPPRPLLASHIFLSKKLQTVFQPALSTFPAGGKTKMAFPLPEVMCSTQLAQQKQLRVGRPGSYRPPLPPRGCLELVSSRPCVSGVGAQGFRKIHQQCASRGRQGSFRTGLRRGRRQRSTLRTRTDHSTIGA